MTLASLLRDGHLFFLLTSCVAGNCLPVFGQLPGQVKDVHDQLRVLEEQVEGSKRNTSRFLNERRIREGPCENLYDFPRSEIYLMPADVLHTIDELHLRFGRLANTLQPVADIETELTRLRSQVKAAQNQLDTTKGQQAEIEQNVERLETVYWRKRKELEQIQLSQINAIRAWLLERYGTETIQMRPEGSKIVITTTLFGTFITDYPRAMLPDAPAEVRVLFAPIVLTADVWPSNISVGALGYSSAVADYVKLTPAFEGSHFTPVKPGEPVTWAWTIHSPRDFKGAKFNLKMGVRRDAGTGGGSDIVAAELPIDITALPGEWSRVWVLLSGLFSGAVMVEALRFLLGWLLRKRDERRMKREPKIIRPH